MLSEHATSNWTITSSGTTIRKLPEEQDDFKELIAFKGLKVVDVFEQDGNFCIKCRRNKQTYTIKINSFSVQIFDADGKLLFTKNISIPNYTTYTTSGAITQPWVVDDGIWNTNSASWDSASWRTVTC